MFMAEETDTPAINWKTLARDLGIAILLVVVTFELFGQARAHAPIFQPEDIHVVEAPVAGYTTVRVWEVGPGPRHSETLRSRSALLLEGYPPNLAFYVPGWNMDMEARFKVGSIIRLEIIDDPAAQAARARGWPEATIQQAILGMQYGDEVFFRALDSFEGQQAWVRTYSRLGAIAGIAALAWWSWMLWSWRRGLRSAIAAREW